MIKWGIIGAGNIAHRFCRALAKDKRAKLEAVSCRTMEKAKAFKMIYPCNKAYDSFQKILKQYILLCLIIIIMNGLKKLF